MIIFPAIDLRAGRCVRLRQGRPDAQTVFSTDPVATARQWVREGATWLHVVDLDAALGEASANGPLVKAIVEAAGVPVQFGGGLRTLAAVEAAWDLGVARLVLGTAAVRNPALVEEAVARLGSSAVAVGIDSREGKVAVHGWQDTTEIDALALALRMKALGVERVICTDTARDGMLRGPNLAALRVVAEKSGLKVIASGGVSSLDDVRALAAIAGIEGVIIGQALYSGAVSLGEVITVCAG